MDKNSIVEVVNSESVVKEVYKDVVHPAAQTTGEIINLIPRAVKAALLPVEKWLIGKEYNLASTRKLLDEQLKCVDPKKIIQPEPYVAVPALQCISYCIDNFELRNMYAKLLANSMIDVVKNNVHPGFVEIIKQLCPDEAKILKYFYQEGILPTISLRCTDREGNGFFVERYFSNVGEIACCEQPLSIGVYLNNFVRLGLVEISSPLECLTDKREYEVLKANPYILERIDKIRSNVDKLHNVPEVLEGYVSLTDFGKQFCRICIDDVRG